MPAETERAPREGPARSPVSIRSLDGTIKVPFDLVGADIRADAIVPADEAAALSMHLIAPDGTELAAGSPGVDEVVTDTYRFLRLTPSIATPATGAGRWTAVLTADRRQLRNWTARLRKRLASRDDPRADELFQQILTALDVHGVPFTLTVQARTALHLGVQLTQQSRQPGEPASLQATLTDSGIPLVASARLEAHVREPAGSSTVVPLARDGHAYAATIPTTATGTYEVRVVAEGHDLRGDRFTREELRSLNVWARGDEPGPTRIGPNGGSTEWCDLLRCLLTQDTIQESLRRHDIDPDELARCLTRICPA